MVNFLKLFFITAIFSATANAAYFPGPFSIANFPAIQPVSQSGTWSVGINNFPSTQAVTGTFFQATQPVSLASSPLPSNAAQETGGNLATIATNTTGASTSALQTTGNTSLATVATNTSNIPAKGTATMSAAMPINLSNAQTLTTSTFNSATGTLNMDMLTGTASGWYDASSFTSFDVDIYTTTTVTAGAITFEQTNDTTNDAAGITMNLQDSTVLTQSNITALTFTASTVKHYQAPITSRYIRFRFSTAFTGTGTVGATLVFKQTPYVPITTSVNQATSGSLNVNVGTGTIATVSTDNLATNFVTADRASAAATTTYTSATITPSSSQISYSVQLAVTAISGTTPTMACVINESWDSGVTFQTVYQFPTYASTIATYRTPMMRFTGNRIQYVCTIAGTTPSYTFSISRVGSNTSASLARAFYDTTLTPNTASSFSGTFFTEGCNAGSLTYDETASAAQPTLTVQVSEDAVNWEASPITLTPTAIGASFASGSFTFPRFARIFVTTAGTGVTYGYSAFRCMGP
jgi:hypothetical protein